MKTAAFSFTTLLALLTVSTLLLAGSVNALVCCRVPCNKNIDPSCQDTCETGVGDHCYPLNSCPPAACQGQSGMLSAASLKEKTTKVKGLVKKEGLDD